MNEPKPLYLFHMTFGRYGAFLLYPVLLTGLIGFMLALGRRDLRARRFILSGGAALAILTSYYVFKTNNYGGAAYGFRWYITAMPVLLLMGLPVFQRIRKPWHGALLAVVLAVSMYSAWECYRHPWESDAGWPSRWVFGPSFERQTDG